MKKIPLSYWLKATVLTAAAFAFHSASAVPLDVPNPSFEVPRDDSLIGGLPEGDDVYMNPLICDWYQFNILTNGGPQRYWNPSAEPVDTKRFADSGFGGIAPDGDHVGIAITRYNDDRHPDGAYLPTTEINPATGEQYEDTYVRDFEALAQVLEEVLFDPAEAYTLKVMVGHPPGQNGDPDHGIDDYQYNGYAVQIVAGGYEYDQGSAYEPTIYDGTVIAEDNNSQVIAANEFVEITVTYTPGSLTPTEETDLAGLPIQIRLCALENPADHATDSIVAFDNVRLDGPPPPPVLEFIPPAPGNTDFTLEWDSHTGRQYNVVTAPDLETPDPWTPVQSGLTSTPPTNTTTVSPDGTTRFYKVEDVPAP